MKNKVIEKGSTVPEYEIKERVNKKGYSIYELFSTDSKVWEAKWRNKKLLSLEDTKNGMVFKPASSPLDYDKVFYHYILLKYVSKSDKFIFPKFKFVK